jgi:hypothetical protein
MIKWKEEFKKYLAKKFNEKMGFEINPQNIHSIEINTEIKIDLLSIEDLAFTYAFAIMDENFEQAKFINDEFTKRNCEIKINIDEKNHSGTIDVYQLPEINCALLSVQLKVLPDGMMIDFEKQNL